MVRLSLESQPCPYELGSVWDRSSSTRVNISTSKERRIIRKIGGCGNLTAHPTTMVCNTQRCPKVRRCLEAHPAQHHSRVSTASTINPWFQRALLQLVIQRYACQPLRRIQAVTSKQDHIISTVFQNIWHHPSPRGCTPNHLLTTASPLPYVPKVREMALSPRSTKRRPCESSCRVTARQARVPEAIARHPRSPR